MVDFFPGEFKEPTLSKINQLADDVAATTVTIYTGQIADAAASSSLPTDWSVIRQQAGFYRITHNLNLSVPSQDMPVVAQLITNIGFVAVLYQPNSFDLRLYNTTPTAQDWSVTFIAAVSPN